jgi:hypothetical protein
MNQTTLLQLKKKILILILMRLMILNQLMRPRTILVEMEDMVAEEKTL